MICDTYTHGGIGTCKALRDPIRGGVLMTVGTTITAANAAILGTSTTTGWMSILAPLVATSAIEPGVILDFGRNTENTTTPAEITVSDMGIADETKAQMVRLTGYGHMSYSEYQNFFGANGKSFEFSMTAQNGKTQLLTKTATGALKGFRCKIFVTKGGIPAMGADLMKECKFDIVFEDAEEFKNIVEVNTNFTFTDLLGLCPQGLDVDVTTAYEGAGGTATIKVRERNSYSPCTLVATNANIQILSSYNNVATAIATVAQDNAAIGSYLVTSTAALVGPVVARITIESATKRTYVSKPFLLVE